MWISTLSGYAVSVPTLIMLLFCIQAFDRIISATYSNNFAEYLLQIVGPSGATALLSILWIDSTVGLIPFSLNASVDVSSAVPRAASCPPRCGLHLRYKVSTLLTSIACDIRYLTRQRTTLLKLLSSSVREQNTSQCCNTSVFYQRSYHHRCHWLSGGLYRHYRHVCNLSPAYSSLV